MSTLPHASMGLTFSVATFHVDSLRSLGEDALTIVIDRAATLELAVRDEEAFEGATGRRSPCLQRESIAAGAKLGAALVGFDLALKRLEAAGLRDEAAALVERQHRRMRAIDRGELINEGGATPCRSV